MKAMLERSAANNVLKQAAVLLAVVGLGAMSIRTAAVASSSERRPDLAQALWPSHPLPTRARAFAAIGAAAARGQAPPPHALNEMKELSRRDPLADEPFTVAGTAALADGRVAHASALLMEAIERDPRSLAPRYLLADLALRSGATEVGLEQTRLLTRQLGGATQAIAPGLAAFARRPDGVQQLRPILKQDPALRDAVLTSLAVDPAAADVIMALAQPITRGAGATNPAWQEQLLNAFIQRGDVAGAHRVWRRVAGVPLSGGGLYNPEFRQSSAPPPFNWRLVSGSAGLAEPILSGGVRLIFYGREDAVLATQMLVLEPGQYRLTWSVVGPSQDLRVEMSCVTSKRSLGAASLREKQLTWSVPDNCRGQTVEFKGSLSDTPTTVQAEVTQLNLVRMGGR